MSFAEEFRGLDPSLIEQAYARAAEKLLRIAAAGATPSLETVQLHNDITQESFGFSVIIGQHEQALQMIEGLPLELDMRYGQEYKGMLQMRHGLLAAGLILSEYARLESGEA